MNTRIVVITPSLAASLLEMNDKNRKVTPHLVNRYACTMRDGRWKLNGEAIVVADTGRLLDGQHRLMAIIESGVSIRTMIVEGVDENAFDTIDTGRRRTEGDILSIGGGVNNANITAAALKLVYMYYAMGTMMPQRRYIPSAVELLEKYPEVEGAVSSVKHATRRLIAPSVAAACKYIFTQRDASLADEFFDRISTLKFGDSDEPVKVLVKKLQDNAISRAKLSRHHLAALMIKSWNYWRSGTSPKVIRWNDSEAFPEAI